MKQLVIRPDHRFHIISGGQTGVDQMALAAAFKAGIPTTGYAPKDFMTEAGPNKLLFYQYNLVETNGSYSYRTRANVAAAHVTLLYGKQLYSPGTQCTLAAIKSYIKPFFINQPAEAILGFIRTDMERVEGPYLINVAGNRESKMSAITKQEIAAHLEKLTLLLNLLKKNNEPRTDH